MAREEVLELTWTVTEPGLGDAEKHAYVPEKKPTKETSESEKQIIKDYNTMRALLIKHDLMEKKGEA